MAEELFCDTCTPTVESDGTVSHEPDCLRQSHNKLSEALHKVAHILKEAGITAVEAGVEAIGPGISR